MRSTPAVGGLVHMMVLAAGYDRWLCDVLLFELHTGLSGVFARGGCCEERERVARESARSAENDSGALDMAVRYDGHY